MSKMNHFNTRKKRKRKKENTFSYKNKGSEGIVTHESSHNNDVQDFKQYKVHDPKNKLI